MTQHLWPFWHHFHHASRSPRQWQTLGMPVSAARDATWFTWGDAQKKTFSPVKQAIDYQPWEKNQPMGLKKDVQNFTASSMVMPNLAWHTYTQCVQLRPRIKSHPFSTTNHSHNPGWPRAHDFHRGESTWFSPSQVWWPKNLDLSSFLWVNINLPIMWLNSNKLPIWQW